MMIVAVGMLWGLCSVGAFGLMLGLFQKSFPSHAYRHRVQDSSIAFLGALLGPLGLISAIASSMITAGRLYFLLRPISKEESWAAFHKSYPSLSYKYFETGEN